MSVTSPTSASPGLSLMEWDETAVHSYLSHLGLSQYEELIYEHGITGDVLSAMDHATLQDMGITSVGHRLNLLRAVFELKKEQGIGIGDDEWRPEESEIHTKKQMAHVARLWDLIQEQQERLLNLERDHSRLLSTLEESGISVPVATSADGDVMHGMGLGNAAFGSRSRDRTVTQADGGDVNGAGPSRRRNSHHIPSSLTLSTTSTVYAPPLSADSATFKNTYTPTTSNPLYVSDSPMNSLQHERSSTGPRAIGTPQAQSVGRQVYGTSMMDASAVTPPTATPLAPSHGSKPSSSLVPPSSVSTPSGTSPPPGFHSSGGSTVSSSGDPSEREKSKAKDAARNAARSFRVTLDDPCFKVLPAALKKYKINDDWKMYALFICFGNTERCLAYDEKPLMLFQKLKEGGQKPVFMLRHMVSSAPQKQGPAHRPQRDIKSPIAVAQQKQAIKLGLPPGTTEDVLPKIRPAGDGTSPTKISALQPGQRDEGQTPNGGAFPELPSPGLRDGDGSGPNAPKSANGPGTSGTLVDKDGNVQNVTYAVAIYPYIADRQDEFDVAVGATYVILSKAKGWYIVQRDPSGTGNITPDSSHSGWVPAGCLLELHTPIAMVSATNGKMDPAYPGLAPIPTATITSSSYPGVVLMDWDAKADDQITLKEGDMVRVYKKYCHWSYTIKQDTGDRGWIPAWFIGKHGSSGGGDSQPSTAATPTGPGLTHTPSTISTISDGHTSATEETLAGYDVEDDDLGGEK